MRWDRRIRTRKELPGRNHDSDFEMGGGGPRAE